MAKRPREDPATMRANVRLHAALDTKHADAGAARQAIAEGADVNRGEGGWTPLMMACSFGHEEIVEILLSAGADVNAATTRRDEDTDKGETAIHVAAENGHLAIVGKLIAAGANVNARTASGRSVTSAAMTSGAAAAIVRTLIDAGAALGGNELHFAAHERDAELVARLLGMGVDASAPSSVNDGYTRLGDSPLAMAVARNLGFEQKLRFVAEGVQYPPESPAPPPADVLRERQFQIVRLLVEAGADVNQVGESEGGGGLVPLPVCRTPLMMAVESGDAELVKLLLALGADPTLRTSMGRGASAAAPTDALSIARVFGRTDVAAVLETAIESAARDGAKRRPSQ